MKNKVLLLVLLCIAFMNCSENSIGEPDISRNVIIPLSIGNVWNYHGIVYTTDSIQYADYTNEVKIISDSLVSNENWFLSSTKNGNRTSKGPWCLNRADGYWIKTIYNDTLSFSVEPHLRYKYPCNVGDIFQDETDNTGFIWEIVNIDTAIEVQGGKFKCIMFRTNGYNIQTGYHEDFVSINVGLVLTKFYNWAEDEKPYLFGKYELTSFELK